MTGRTGRGQRVVTVNEELRRVEECVIMYSWASLNE